MSDDYDLEGPCSACGSSRNLVKCINPNYLWMVSLALLLFCIFFPLCWLPIYYAPRVAMCRSCRTWWPLD